MDKPFLLIIGHFYNRDSGTSDWVDCFATREEAEQFVESSGKRHKEEGVVIFKDQKGRMIDCSLKEEEGKKLSIFDDSGFKYYKIRNKRIYSLDGNSFDWYQIVDLRKWAQ
jgi:hypothetical protein